MAAKTPTKTPMKTTKKAAKKTTKKTTSLSATMNKVAAEDKAKGAERAKGGGDDTVPAKAPTTPRAAKGGKKAGEGAAKPKAATRAKRPARAAQLAGKGKSPTPTSKGMSALDAAAEVLTKSGKQMGTREMIEVMGRRGLWTSPGGKTPHATLYSAITREIAAKGKHSRFRKTGKGVFAAAGKRG